MNGIKVLDFRLLAFRPRALKPQAQSLKPVFKSAFTLVELLVVIIIIGILAAVAIPQFGDTSTQAKTAALDQSLATVRAAIELYYYQHNNTYPGKIATQKDGGGATAITALHTSASVAFVNQLTKYSNAAGDTSDEKSSSYPFGPYIKPRMPANPLPAATAASAPSGVATVDSSSPIAPDAKPATGWKTNIQTGEFIANHPSYGTR